VAAAKDVQCRNRVSFRPAHRRAAFSLESLEPRVLLSAAAIDPGLPSTPDSFDGSALEITEQAPTPLADSAGIYNPATELDALFAQATDLEIENAPAPVVLDPDESLTGNLETQGSIINHGVLSPGNSPGIINHTGDFTQSSTM
jgi:hypothetical protein